jgi:hydroxyethylthiazole kinase-like sugar kinase family protein
MGSVTSSGISLGSAIAITISWSVNKSILWAILHGLLSWFYVIYYAVNR